MLILATFLTNNTVNLILCKIKKKIIVYMRRFSYCLVIMSFCVCLEPDDVDRQTKNVDASRKFVSRLRDIPLYYGDEHANTGVNVITIAFAWADLKRLVAGMESVKGRII